MNADFYSQRSIPFPIRPKKVLLVDEEDNYLRMLRLTLEGQGFEVLTCTTFQSGIYSLEAEQFDFVVLGQGSKAFEGRPVLELAMRLDRSRPVLVLTRCIDMNCYLEAMQMGAIDYIEKPIPPVELLRYVQAHTSSVEYKVKRASA